MIKNKFINQGKFFLIAFLTVITAFTLSACIFPFGSESKSNSTANNQSYGSSSVITPAEKPTLILPDTGENGKIAVYLYEGELIDFSGYEVVNSNGDSVGGTFKLVNQRALAFGVQEKQTVTFENVEVEFIPNDLSAYLPTLFTVDEITLRATAKINDKYYGTVDSALENANSGDTVLITETFGDYCAFKGIDKKEDAILQYQSLSALTVRKDNQEVKSGVTLSILFDIQNENALYGDFSSSSLNNTLALENKTKYLITNVTVAKGVKLINNGVINIAGEVSCGVSGVENTSFTSGRYGQITMDNNSTLQNNGQLNSYGFICETIQNNGAKVICDSGSVSIAPLTITENRSGEQLIALGGGALQALMGNTSYKCYPFSRFFVQNITTKTIFKKGATFNGFWSFENGGVLSVLYPKLVGNGADCLLNLNDNKSKFIVKYNENSKIATCDLFGNAEINGLTLKVKYNKSEILISTKGNYLPISWHYNINLHSAEDGSSANVNFNQNLKLLCGASLVIGEGVFVNANSIAVYAKDFLTNESQNLGDFKYENGNAIKKPNAELIVNGALTVKNIGGKILTESDKATLKVLTGNSVSICEINSSSYTKEWSLNATADLYGLGNDYFLPIGSYKSNGVEWLEN